MAKKITEFNKLSGTPTFIPVDKIVPSPLNPRRTSDQQGIDELAASILTQGLIQPLVVRLTDTDDGIYELISGERRLRAIQKIGEKEVLCLIRDASTYDAVEVQFMENHHRADVTPEQRSNSLKMYIENYCNDKAEAARRLGVSRTWVNQVLELSDLSPLAREMSEKKLVRDSSTLVLLSRLERESPETAAKLVASAQDSGKLTRASVIKARAPFARRGKNVHNIPCADTQSYTDYQTSPADRREEVRTSLFRAELDALMKKTKASTHDEAIRLVVQAFLAG